METHPPLPGPAADPPPHPARRSMLAWWGIFPAAIFVAVQCYFGWSEAKARSNGLDYAFGFLMGGLLFGLGIAFLLGWILYRIDSRSQRTATIAFSVVILFFAAAMAHQAQKQHAAQISTTGAPMNPTTTPVVISEATAKRLEFPPEPVALFGGEVMVNYPAFMEPFNTAPGAQKYAVGMWDLSHKLTDFAAMIQLVPLLKGDSLTAHADLLGRLTQEKYKLTEAFRWHPLHGHRVGTITQSIVGQPNPRANRIMWAIVALDDKRLIVINYSIWAQEPEDRAAYEAAAEKIAETVSPGTAGK